MSRFRPIQLTVPLLLLLTLIAVRQVFAHQPWFEDFDFTESQPFLVRDATVSTAIYSMLERNDRDYFQFEASAGQTVLLEITIPQITGMEAFDPTMHLFGPGIAADGYEIPSVPATEFFEPFSRTSYWDRQEENVTLEEGGTFTVAVSHPAGERGKYVFVIGTRETGGGDPAFGNKMRAYWQPLQPEPTPAPVEETQSIVEQTEAEEDISSAETAPPTPQRGLCNRD